MIKTHKIVDTIQNFGRAEEYLTFSNQFNRFMQGLYRGSNILETDPKELVKKFNLKGVVFGNYVTQEERFHFLFKIKHQLEALAKVAKTNNLGLGVLIIAFGAEGKSRSLAHYNADKQLINLNRGRAGDYKDIMQGENSFIHEYGHFIDFVEGRGNKLIPYNFYSEAHVQGQIHLVENIPLLVSKLYDNQYYVDRLGTQRNSKYLLEPWEMFARLFETVFTHYVESKMKDKADFFREGKYKNSNYLTKDEIKKGNFEKGILSVIRNIKNLKA